MSTFGCSATDRLALMTPPEQVPEQVLFAARAVSLDDGAMRVEAEGELDLATAPQLEEVLRRELDGGGLVVLDLSGVTFMDSSGLHAILTVVRAANETGTRMQITGSMLPQVKRLIEITGLQDVFHTDGDSPRRPEAWPLSGR
jgi:anti-sigma B factor antagonist